MRGLGERIRSLRKSRHMTIMDVAKSTGIDQATLSRIENGKMTGTLDSHRRIAEVLGLRLPELYETVMQQIAHAKDKKALQKLETFSHSSGAVAELLTTASLQKKMMPVLLRLRTKGHTETEEYPVPTERFIYIVKGAVELRLGKESKNLKQNEGLYFNGSVPHQIWNRHKSESCLVSVITPSSL